MHWNQCINNLFFHRLNYDIVWRAGCVLQAFAKIFHCTPDELDMHLIYDVSHNVAKIEEHMVEGKQMTLCVHRKGATRAFAPHHPLIPVDYQLTGKVVPEYQ